MKPVLLSSWLLIGMMIGSLALAQQGSPLYRSTDNGKTWHPWNKGLNGTVRVDRIMSHSKNYYLLTEGHGLYVSSDEGRSWTKPGFSMLLPQKGDVIHVFNGLLWLGTYEDGVLVSADQGNSWVPCNKGLENQTIRAFHSQGKQLWVGTNDGVYQWDASNSIWKAQLAGIQVNDFAQLGPQLFVATHKGIQVSKDQGTHWKTASVDGTITQLYQWEGELLACSMRQKVWKYDPTREAWRDHSTFFPAKGLSTTILYGDEEVIYATQDQHLYRKYKGQAQWELVSNGLDQAVHFRDLKMVQPGVFLLACTAKP